MKAVIQQKKQTSGVQTNPLSQIAFQTTSFKIIGEPKTSILRFCLSDTVLVVKTLCLCVTGVYSLTILEVNNNE